MQEELKEYSNVLKEIVKKSTYRATSIPKEYRSLLKEQIYSDLFLKGNNILYGWSKDNMEQFNNQLTEWFSSLSICDALSNVNDFLINFFNNYQNNLRNTSMSISARNEYINNKQKAIVSYQNNLKGYFATFECEKENNDESVKVLSSIVNVIASAISFYDAKRVCDNSTIGKLTYLASATMTIEALNTFTSYKNSKKQIMYKISELHNYFKNMYCDLDLEEKRKIYTNITQAEFEKSLLEIRDNKYYFLNLVYLAYNQVNNRFFSSITKEVLDVIKNQDLIPEKLLSSNAILTLVSYFNDKRVDTMKEAINLFFTEQKEDEKYNKIVNEMNQKVQSLTNELNNTKQELNERTLEMEEAYETLRKKHNELVDDHNKLINDHNSLVDKHNDAIKIAREIKDELSKY